MKRTDALAAIATIAAVALSAATVVLLGSTVPGRCIVGVAAAAILAFGVLCSAARIAPEIVRIAREA